jgi:hypothetical protein
MAANTRTLAAAALIAGTAALPAHAERVACHVTYGGETRIIGAAASTQALTVAPVSIGSYFLFRIVFRKEPADLATIKLYTYADRDDGPTIIHQATYAYPPAPGPVHGFTGLNFIYEPVRDGELQYWCELKGQP